MRRVNWLVAFYSALCVALVAFIVWLTVRDVAAMKDPARRKASEDWWERRRQATQATPERWAKCREVCGESAALLPVGDGNFGVVCSCVPKNWRTTP